MLIDDLFRKLESNGDNSYSDLETFVLNLLEIHQEKSGRPFDSRPRRIGFDAFAQDGIDEIKGPTQIEVRFNLRRRSPRRLLDQIRSISSQVSRTEKFENLLIITNERLSHSLKSRIHETLLLGGFDYNLHIWGAEELNSIVSKHRKEAREIADNLFSLRIKSVVTQIEKDWEKERAEKVSNLCKLYKKGQFSLFLGAGVSSSAGMPDWNTLLNSLFVTYLTTEFDNEVKISDTDIEDIVKRLNEIDEPSALMAARYLRKGLDRNESNSAEFIQAITENLYKLRNKKRNIDSELIRAIVEMCMPRRTGAKIKSVITYNFDDLLERQLASQSIQHHTSYTDDDFIDPDSLPVYHVHGFLPEDSSKYDSLEKSTLVFSEEGYHQIYSDSYHWSNLAQLSNLRENHCLMVGLSMSDPNLRRLLEISSRNTDKSKHFAFMKRLTLEQFGYRNSNKVIKNLDGAKKFLDRHHNLNEEIMRELGVSIIWYTEYDEIPSILKEIVKNGAQQNL